MKKLIYIMALAGICLGLTACVKSKAIPLSATIQAEQGVEINSTVTVAEMVEVPQGYTLENGDEYVDTSSTGAVTFDVKLKNEKGKSAKANLSVIIIDTQRPEIYLSQDRFIICRGETPDFESAVATYDNSNTATTAIQQTDFSVPGEYQTYITATDSSGNTAQASVSVVVLPQGTQMFTTQTGHTGYTLDGVTYIDGYLIANKTYSVPEDYGDGITAEAQAAFDRMQAAAANDGISIWIRSGYRSYSYQTQLYNNYAARDGYAARDTYSARPGYSEHQTGLGMDLNLVDDSFEYTPAYRWLQENCYKYGFVLRYVKGKTIETGYIYESWHYRYVGEALAHTLYNGGDWITIENYFGITSRYGG